MPLGTVKVLRDTFQSAYAWAEPNMRYALRTRQPVVWVLSAAIGLSTAIAAIIFRELIGLVQLPWLGTASEQVASAARGLPWIVVLIAPAVGGLIVGILLQRYMPGRRTFGVADVIEARTLSGRELPLKDGVFSAFITAISLGSGASSGREGPVVHLGATIGSALCQRFGLPTSSRRVLLACGVAGAVSASFNAPIAGVLFAHEVILGHYALSAFTPIVIASVVGTIVSRAYFGDVAAFIIPDYQITSYWEIPAFALLGLTCAAVAIIFQYALIGTDFFARSIKAPLWIRPVVGGLMIGAIAVFFPQVLGVGYQATDLALRNTLPLDLLIYLLIAKTAAVAITLASRFGGGIFSPSLYLGAMAGSAFGLIAGSTFPDMASSQGLYAILGMGAVAAAVLGAPVSTTVIIFELTGGYALSVALLLTVAISTGVTQAVHGRSFFHWQLESRGLALQDGPHRYLMRTTRVTSFMEAVEPKPFEGEVSQALRPDDSLERALRLFNDTGASVVPVVDGRSPPSQIARVRHVQALRLFNKQLIDTSIEEHH